VKFIDLHVHSVFSHGVDTPSRLLVEAKKLRIGIGLCDGRAYEHLSGIEINFRNKKELRNAIKKFENLDYIIVHGGLEKTNRLAVSDSRIDILAHPDQGRRDSGIDAFIARKASENDVAIEVNLSRLFSSRRIYRVYALMNIKRNLFLSRKYGFDIVVTSGARSRYELRKADVVCEILKSIGFENQEISRAMKKVQEIIR
jgi:ribonuclease P/MRP protein subunit RPP1